MTKITLVAVALVATVLFAGVAAAQGPFAPAADRPADGTNSPWLVGDDRLDRIQERYDLTDAEIETVRAAAAAAAADGLEPGELRSVVEAELAELGVDDAGAGPADRERRYLGPRGDGPRGDGTGPQAGPRGGNGFGGGPRAGFGDGPRGDGLRDGSCLTR